MTPDYTRQRSAGHAVDHKISGPGAFSAAVALPVDFTQAAAEGAGRQMIGGFDRGSRSPVESGLAATAKPLADAAKRSSILLIADCKSVWISLCRMSNQ
jgi:hypothetical protein